MDPTEIAVQATQQFSPRELLELAGVWLAGPLLMHINLQQWKAARRSAGRPKPGPWALRLAAAAGSWAVAFVLGAGLWKWPLERVLWHALVVALFYPLLVHALLRFLQKREPQLAADFGATHLGADAPTELRVPGDEDITEQPAPPAPKE